MDFYFITKAVFGGLNETQITKPFRDDVGNVKYQILPNEIVAIKVVSDDNSYIINAKCDNNDIPNEIVKKSFDLFMEYSKFVDTLKKNYIYDPYGNEIGYECNGETVYYDNEYE